MIEYRTYDELDLCYRWGSAVDEDDPSRRWSTHLLSSSREDPRYLKVEHIGADFQQCRHRPCQNFGLSFRLEGH